MDIIQKALTAQRVMIIQDKHRQKDTNANDREKWVIKAKGPHSPGVSCQATMHTGTQPILSRSSIAPRSSRDRTIEPPVSKRNLAKEATGNMGVERHQVFNIWVSNFSDKPIFLPKGMMVV